jgi:hypothetical protein
MLSNDIDDALSESDRQILANHLKTCNRCRKEHATFVKLSESMSRLDAVQVPADFSRRVIQKITIFKHPAVITMPFIFKLRSIATPIAVAGVILLSLVFGNYIGKSLYKEILGGRVHRQIKNIETFGIDDNHAFVDSMCYVLYNRIKPEAKNE